MENKFKIENGTLIDYSGNERTIIIPLKVNKIGYKCFYKNDLIEKVVLNNDVTIIGERAFEGCKNLEEVKMTDSVTKILSDAFRDCESLTKIKLSNNLTGHLDAFIGCANLEELYVPDKVEGIGIFWGCNKLKKVHLSNNITRIPCACFKDNSSLEEINIPHNIEFFERESFLNCTSLKEIKLYCEAESTSFGAYCFEGCQNLNIHIHPNKLGEFNHANGVEALTHCQNIYFYGTEDQMFSYFQLKKPNETTQKVVLVNDTENEEIKEDVTKEQEYEKVGLHIRKINGMYQVLLKGDGAYFYTLKEALNFRDKMYKLRDQEKVANELKRIWDSKGMKEYPLNIISLIEDRLPQSVINKGYDVDYFYNNFESNLQYILNHFKYTDNEKLTLKLRFEEYQTLEAVGNQIGVTRERVRQIETKAIRKLLHPTRIKIFLYGPDVIKAEEDIEILRAKLANEKNKLVEEMISIQKNGLSSTDAEKFKNSNDYILNIPIVKLNLSVRSTNCLVKELGYNAKVSDLLMLSPDDILKIRNIGRKSYKEITEIMREYLEKTNFKSNI